MKMSTKIVILALLATLSILILASCHGAKDYDAFVIPEAFDLNEEYEIVFWAKNEKNIKQTKVYQKAIEDFEKIYPNINVTLKLYSDYNIIYHFLTF